MDRRTVFNGRLLPAILLLPQLLLTLFFFYWPAGEAVWSSMITQDAFGQGFVLVPEVEILEDKPANGSTLAKLDACVQRNQGWNRIADGRSVGQIAA